MLILAWLVGPIGRYVLIAAAVTAMLGGLYVKGRVDGKTAYQAKLTRQMNKAIAKGNQAEADALKKFDSDKEVENDGFSRD